MTNKIIITETKLKSGTIRTTVKIEGKITHSLAETLIDKGFEGLGVKGHFTFFEK